MKWADYPVTKMILFFFVLSLLLPYRKPVLFEGVRVGVGVGGQYFVTANPQCPVPSSTFSGPSVATLLSPTILPIDHLLQMCDYIPTAARLCSGVSLRDSSE